ncbi:MAG TPA: serine/threonine-protein kinase [Labilithrix sp.]|nr:serine/threonine-protein kinase [Labilithrix sp.]
MAIGATKPATPAAVSGAASGERGQELWSAATIPPDAQTSQDEQLPPGTLVADRYRIARVLGAGGMGVVYAAEHVLMRKEVALKILHAEMCVMPEVVARFEREAIAAAHIDHPNVAAATDFGRLPDGACYLVLELLRGTSLRDEIAAGPIPLGRALRILRGIVAGVAAAHAKGIVHRDLKPENVMLVNRPDEPDFVKVLDFGIAKLDASASTGPDVSGKVLTRAGSVFGTPEYMAPEQAVGDSVDARADLYALGVIFLEMLTGKCPFAGNAISILRARILSVGPPDMSGVDDAGARALIARLLTRQPDDRMQTATELATAIDALLEQRQSGSPPPRVSGESGPSIAPAIPSVAPAMTSPVIHDEARGGRGRWIIPAAATTLLGISVSVFAFVVAHGRPTTEVTPAATQADTTASAETPRPPASEATSPSASGSTPAQSSPAGAESAAPAPSVPPSASAASARAAPKKPAPRKRPPPAPKKTGGPGGIYVPPPKDWFK